VRRLRAASLLAAHACLLVARTAAALGALARELGAEDDHRLRVDALAADVTSAGARLGLVDVAIARDVNVLINAATAEANGPIADIDAKRADLVLQTNLLAPVHLTRALLPHLLHRPEARIFNIGSALGGSEWAGTAVYSASRSGLHGFTESLQRELVGANVRVQFLAPAAPDAEPEHVARAVLRSLLMGSATLARLSAMLPLWLAPT